MKTIILSIMVILPSFVQAQKQHTAKRVVPQVGISLLGGIQNTKGFNAAAPMYGVEISFQCPMVSSKRISVSQHVRLTHQEDEKLRSTTLEMNPQYNFITNAYFTLGIGPSAGIIFANAGGDQKSTFSCGLGASSVFYIKNISIGMGLGYAMTNKVSFNNSDYESAGFSSLYNLKTFIKFGLKI